MPAEGGASQPPAPKAQPVSAFINKGGKTFAPGKKIVRRRPGAAAAASASKPAAPTPTPEPQTIQTEPQAQPDTAPVPEQQTLQLPTPAPTQEPAAVDVPRVDPAVSAPSNIAAEPSIPAVDPSQAPAPRLDTAFEDAPTPSLERAASPIFVEHESDFGRSPKRQRVEPSKSKEHHHAGNHIPHTEATVPPVQPMQPLPEPTALSTPDETANQDAPPVGVPTVSADAPAEGPTTTEVENGAGKIRTSETRADPGSTRSQTRALPWAAVNALPDGEEEAAPTATRPQATRTKRKRKAATLREMDEEDEQEGGEEEVAPIPRQAGARARGKRKAREPALGDEEEAPQPARKPRKTRKTQAQRQVAQGAAEGAAEEEEGGAAGEPNVAPVRKRTKRKKKTTPEQPDGVEGRDGDGPQQPKRKGRPPRESTPPDAEHDVIDGSAVFMSSLASRNIRVGRLSEREKKMREINWDEVKQRQREKEATHTDGGRADQEEVTRKLNEEAEARNAVLKRMTQPQLTMVNGQIVFDQSVPIVDPNAAAEQEMQDMVIVEEDDLTNRVTYRSFMRNGKRHPQDFMLPGQGKKWDYKDTEDFYRALTMFGTDFMMISTLFPGVTRRSVKLKFVREEKRDPQRVKETLHGRGNSDWQEYLATSGRDEASFVDPDEINRQLAEERMAMEVEIEAARAAAEEEKRQRRLAGVDSGDEGGDKENGKKKKGRRDKKKQVTFEAEEGVEVLGEVDEDDGWGQE